MTTNLYNLIKFALSKSKLNCLHKYCTNTKKVITVLRVSTIFDKKYSYLLIHVIIETDKVITRNHRTFWDSKLKPIRNFLLIKG